MLAIRMGDLTSGYNIRGISRVHTTPGGCHLCTQHPGNLTCAPRQILASRELLLDARDGGGRAHGQDPGARKQGGGPSLKEQLHHDAAFLRKLTDLKTRLSDTRQRPPPPSLPPTASTRNPLTFIPVKDPPPTLNLRDSIPRSLTPAEPSCTQLPTAHSP